MTVTAQVATNSSTAVAGATVFPYTFQIVLATDLLVTVNGITKTLTTDYTVSGVGASIGGNVTFVVPMVGGEAIVFQRNMAYSRLADYQHLGDLLSATLNNDQDAPVLMIQQVAAGTTLEAAARIAGDATNAAAISAEATTRASADTTEATARAAADTAEASARTSGDATNASAITSEATTRAAADTTNANAITSEASTRAAADTAEASARSAGDATNATAIGNESLSRSAADTGLRTYINSTLLYPTNVKTANYAAAATDFVCVDASAVSVTITLPTAPADGTRVGVKMIAVSGAFTTTIAAGGTDVFNKTAGATTLTLSKLNQSAILQYFQSAGIWYLQAEAGIGGGSTAPFGASGASHAQGLVPDPGATAGTTRYLREDATFAVPAGSGSTSFTYPATGASVRDLVSRGADALCILDFISPTQHAAIRAGTSTFDCLAAFQAALAVLDPTTQVAAYGAAGPVIFVPVGLYNMSGTLEIKRRVRIVGEGSGGANGSEASRLLWPANTTGIIIHAYNTIGVITQATPTTAGSGSVLYGLHIEGTLAGTSGSTTTGHGVWLRGRATIEQCKILNFPLDGIHLYASAGSGGITEGNVNGWSAKDCRISNCGVAGTTIGHGVFIKGADVNAGTTYSMDIDTCSGWGIWDSSFLGNTHIAPESASCALGSYKSDGVNARVTWIGAYSEGGTAYGTEFAGQSLVVGGPVGPVAPAVNITGTGTMSTLATAVARCVGGVVTDIMMTNMGVGYTTAAATIGSSSGSGATLTPVLSGGQIVSITVTAGGSNYAATEEGMRFLPSNLGQNSNITPFNVNSQTWHTRYINTNYGQQGQATQWNALGDHPSGLAWAWDETNGCWMMQHAAAARYGMRVATNLSTGVTCGRTTAVVGGSTLFAADNLYVGSSVANARRISNSATIPVTTGSAVGEIVFNSAATVGGVVGWMCTTQGSPDTWTAFGVVGPSGGGQAAQVNTFTASGTYTKPTGATALDVFVVAGGGGGGSGRKGAAGTVRCGGGGGGAGGRSMMSFVAADISATVTITAGAGGAGGAAQTTNSTNGNAGGAGGFSQFGNYVVSGGSGAGSAGSATFGSGGPGGFAIDENGGAGGSADTSGSTGGNSAGTIWAPTGGAAGGGITAANVASSGGLGFTPGQMAGTSGGAQGGPGVAGGNGVAYAATHVGNGGGGGGASITATNAGAGGNGGNYGAGGGGGGAGLDATNNSGAGGNGAPGIVVVITYF